MDVKSRTGESTSWKPGEGAVLCIWLPDIDGLDLKNEDFLLIQAHGYLYGDPREHYSGHMALIGGQYLIS